MQIYNVQPVQYKLLVREILASNLHQIVENKAVLSIMTTINFEVKIYPKC